MRFARPGLVLATTSAALALAGPAAAADSFSVLPTQALSFHSATAQELPCDARLRADLPNVDDQLYTAPAEGYATFRLAGPASDDWDLAVFDQRSGAMLDTSQGFHSSETVQAWAHVGQKLVVQACHRAGTTSTIPGSVEFAVGAWPKAPNTPEQAVDIPLTNSRVQIPELDRLGLDVDETSTNTDSKALITDPSQLVALKKAGFAYTIIETDVLADLRASLAEDDRRAAAEKSGREKASTSVPSGRTTYRTLDDYQSELKMLAAKHPAIVRGITLPEQTFQGRDTMGVEISGNVNATDDQKPTSFIMGVHHAREWPAGEIAIEEAYYLIQQYEAGDPGIRKLLDTTRVVIVPIINSDGFEASRSAPDPADLSGNPNVAPVLLGPGFNPELAEGALIPAGGTLAYRRKNCDGLVPSGATPCDAQAGVDPNRNYGFFWGGKGTSTSPNSQSYRGTGPWSEPETQAVHEFSQVHDVTTLLTLHTIAALVLRPPGLHDNGMAPDETRLKKLGDQMAADTGYTSEYSYMLYDTSGTTEDWNYGAAGTFGYTIELGPGDTATTASTFHGTYQEGVIDQWNGAGKYAGKGMRSAIQSLIGEATDPTIFSTLTGTAPAGRVLRVHKSFDTATSHVCAVSNPTDVNAEGVVDETLGTDPMLDCVDPGAQQMIPDKLDYTTRVPASGTFSWLITPSTHPFVKKAGGTESWTLTCEDTAGKVYDTRTVTIDRGQTQNYDLPCGGKSGTTSTAGPTTTGTTTTPPSSSTTDTTTPPAATTTDTTTPPAATTTDTTTPPASTTTDTTTPPASTTVASTLVTPGTPPGSTTTVDPGTTPGGSLADKLAPLSRFTKHGGVTATRAGITLKGTSTDVAPRGLKRRLARVYVSIGRKVGSQCRFLTSRGTFGPLVSCLRTTYIPAKGTTHWSVSIEHALPAGKYLAWVRGVDAFKNTERKQGTRNLVHFTIH